MSVRLRLIAGVVFAPLVTFGFSAAGAPVTKGASKSCASWSGKRMREVAARLQLNLSPGRVVVCDRKTGQRRLAVRGSAIQIRRQSVTFTRRGVLFAGKVGTRNVHPWRTFAFRAGRRITGGGVLLGQSPLTKRVDEFGRPNDDLVPLGPLTYAYATTDVPAPAVFLVSNGVVQRIAWGYVSGPYREGDQLRWQDRGDERSVPTNFKLTCVRSSPTLPSIATETAAVILPAPGSVGGQACLESDGVWRAVPDLQFAATEIAGEHLAQPEDPTTTDVGGLAYFNLATGQRVSGPTVRTKVERPHLWGLTEDGWLVQNDADLGDALIARRPDGTRQVIEQRLAYLKSILGSDVFWDYPAGSTDLTP